MDKYLFLSEMNRAGYSTQESLAKKLGVSYKTVNNHINGITKVSTEEAVKYCNVLGIYDDHKIVQIFLPNVSRKRDRVRDG